MVDEKESNWMKYLMTYGWAVLLIFVVIAVLLYIGIITPESNNIVISCNSSSKFIEFYGAECSHCANMIPVVAQVENETSVTFERLEVWHNDTNQQLFTNYSVGILKDCPGGLGVPTFFSLQTGKAVCGEMSESSLKDFVNSNC
jgi:hypothetical protein